MTKGGIAEAAALAAERHEGQLRKGAAGLPYVVHCEEVAALVRDHGGDEAAVVAAWMHDIVEDTPTTLVELEERFGPKVASIVAEVTDDPKLSKTEARAAQIAGAFRKSPAAALVKAADQTSNMRSIIDTPPRRTAKRPST